MVAIVDEYGNQEFIEMAPDTPRIIPEIKELDRYMSNSRKATNPDMFNKDGTNISKKEADDRNLKWEYSKSYFKAKDKRRTLYNKNTRQREISNNTLANHILSLGDEFILDKNQYKAWAIKLCRANESSQEQYTKRGRKKDYTKQIHDRCPGYLSAKIQNLCKGKKLKCTVIKNFNSSSYNHFTKTEDIFLELNQRTGVIKLYDFEKGECEYIDKMYTLKETFTKLKDDDGNEYIVQRDLLGASKLLFCKNVEVFKDDGSSFKDKKYTTIFDQEGYSEWFKTTFYPKHLKYIEQLIKDYDLGKNINGLIIGD